VRAPSFVLLVAFTRQRLHFFIHHQVHQFQARQSMRPAKHLKQSHSVFLGLGLF
jgi:hypothetical protein